jgi:hypothetical protein
MEVARGGASILKKKVKLLLAYQAERAVDSKQKRVFKTL